MSLKLRQLIYILLLVQTLGGQARADIKACKDQQAASSSEDLYQRIIDDPRIKNPNGECNERLIQAIKCCHFPAECGMPEQTLTDVNDSAQGVHSQLQVAAYNTLQYSNYFRRVARKCEEAAKTCEQSCVSLLNNQELTDEEYFLGKQGATNCEDFLTKPLQCYKKQGDAYEEKAKDLSETERRMGGGYNDKKAAILCTEDKGYKDCQYIDYQQSKFKDNLNTEELGNQNFKAVRLEAVDKNGNWSSCSGTLVGDSFESNDIVTAGHCTEALSKAEKIYAYTYDNDGNLSEKREVSVSGSLHEENGVAISGHTDKSGNLLHMAKEDTAIYKVVGEPIKQKYPTLQLTVDDSIQGCEKTNVFLRCNSSAIQQWEKYQAVQVHHPNNQIQPVASTGRITYNPNTRTISSNMTGVAGGSSGSGIMMSWRANDGQFYNIIMAPHWGETRLNTNDRKNTSYSGKGVVPEYSTVQSLYKPSISSDKIVAGQSLMRDFETQF